MQIFSILSALSLTSAFLAPPKGVHHFRSTLTNPSLQHSFQYSNNRNSFDPNLISQQPFKSGRRLNAFSSFDGEFWLKRYDSVFSSPYSEYSHIIHMIEGVLQKRELSLDDKEYLIKLFNEVGIPSEFDQYLSSYQAEDSYQPVSSDYMSPVYPGSGYPSVTTRYPEIPSERFRDDIPKGYRILKDPRSLLNRRSVQSFIEHDGFTLQDMKYLSKMVREDYEFRTKVKKYISSSIHHKLLSDELLPYFIDIMKTIYYSSTDHEFYGKIHHLKVKVDDNETLTFYDYFSKAQDKLSKLKKHLEDSSLSASEKFEHIIQAMKLDYKNGSPLSLSDLCHLLISTRNNHPIIVLQPELISEFSNVVKDLRDPLEVVSIASLLGIPTEFQADMINRFDLTNEQQDNFKWLGHQMANLNSEHLAWVLHEFIAHRTVSYPSVELKLDLLSGSVNHDRLSKHWQAFDDHNDFSWFVKILIDYSGLLSKQEKAVFYDDILDYLGKTKPSEEKRDLILKGLRAMQLGGSSDAVESIIHDIKEACNQASPDKNQIMVMVDQLMLEMHHWSTRDILDYIVLKHGQDRTRKRQQNLSDWLQQDSQEHSIDIQGIALPINDDPVHPQMVPEKDSASLVMTKTAKLVLKNLAGQWRTGSVTLLEGPTSAGKTSYVKYMSYLTNSPYMRINLSANTDVRDLIGRWVGGEERFSREELNRFSNQQLKSIGKNMGVEDTGAFKREKLVEQILETQKEAHWEDGPVVQAMREGMVLLLDELNLAKPQVIEALNSLFDSGRLTLDDHGGEVVRLHPKTHIFATMNPSSYVGRNSMSEAFLSRCNKLWVEAPDTEDVVQIVETLYPGVIPQIELAKLVSTHEALTHLADQGHIGKTLGGIAYTLRNLFRVVERFSYFQGKTSLSQEQLLLREFREVYLSTITDEDELKIIHDILLLNMPVDEINFYENLEFTVDAEGFTIGDMRVKRLNLQHSDLIPDLSQCEVVMTDRTKKIFYKMVKALELGEHVALVGERASGKTILAEYYAALRGQPFYRQVFSAKSDNMELIGMYTPHGWQNGLLVRAGLSADQGKGDSPGVFLADEFNQANDAVQERLNSLLDKDRTLFLSEKGGGEKVVFDEDFRFIAAFNPPSYAGRKRLSKAMQSRLSVQFVPNLEEKEEYQLIFSTIALQMGISTGLVNRLVDLHFWVIEQVEARELGEQLIKNKYIFSIRQLKNALKSLSILTAEQEDVVEGFKLAAELVYESVFESEEDKEKIRTKVKELCR